MFVRTCLSREGSWEDISRTVERKRRAKVVDMYLGPNVVVATAGKRAKLPAMQLNRANVQVAYSPRAAVPPTFVMNG